jgi:hypothetical protein
MGTPGRWVSVGGRGRAFEELAYLYDVQGEHQKKARISEIGIAPAPVGAG